MFRPPPRSPPFPYPPLSQSSSWPSSDRPTRPRTRARRCCGSSPTIPPIRGSSCSSSVRHRSEEHTSELQSRQYLVCRLLLEKKKKLTRKDVHRHHTRKGIEL